MPPKRKGNVMLSELVDSDSEAGAEQGEHEDTITLRSNDEDGAPAKKGRGRPKAAGSKKAESSKAAPEPGEEVTIKAKRVKTQKTTTSKRKALKENGNSQCPSDAGETERLEATTVKGQSETALPVSDDELDSPVVAVKQPPKARKPRQKKVEPAQADADDKPRPQPQQDSPQDLSKAGKAKSKPTSTVPKSRGRKQAESKEQKQEELVIPETQEVPMDIDQSPLQLEEPASAVPTTRTSRQKPNGKPNPSRKAGKMADTTSDAEKGTGDPALRKRLHDMTKKFENLDTSYQKLQEVGIKEAEANFDRLKKQTDEKAKAANDLIASLKKELAVQAALAKESRSLQKQLSKRDTDLSEAQTKSSQLSVSLMEAQNENKTLQAKLAASRTAAAAVESVHSRVPGSAIKTNGSARTLMVGSAEAAQAAQTAQLKEDLYSDLTGLIMRGVKRGGAADVYDCIQTGRNGTLHFKLAIATESKDKRVSYEDTEFQYTPHLDASRDCQLLELLPDYLTEEITFSRQNAAKFYGRVVEALTKRKAED